MDFLQNFIQLDPINNTVKVLLLIFLLSLILIVIGFYLDFLKNKKNEKKLNILERAIKDLIEEFRTIELSLSDQKKILNNYKYTLERLDQEISRLADSSEGDSNITNAIKMANQGKSIDEISQTTGMTKEEIEPIIKYHGRS
jgi:predicted PurR-regulated permease PerM